MSRINPFGTQDDPTTHKLSMTRRYPAWSHEDTESIATAGSASGTNSRRRRRTLPAIYRKRGHLIGLTRKAPPTSPLPSSALL
jgi:hypothetical protein